MPVEYGERKTYAFFIGTVNVSLPTGHRGGDTSGSLRLPASIDEQCKYFQKPLGCRMGSRCAYRHSTYRTDENWRRRVFERQQHTNLDVDRRVSEEKKDASNASGGSVNGESDSSSDYDLVIGPLGLLRSSMSPNRVELGILGFSSHDAHRHTPSGSEAESDSENEFFLPSPDSDDDERIHFYGAPGGFRVQESKEASDWRFAVASAIELEERCCRDDEEAPIARAQEKPCDSQPCSKPREVCRFFPNGQCPRGVQCLYAHPVELAQADELYTEQEDNDEVPSECGVCLNIVTDKFGILTGCDHVFCLSCLGKWRHKGKQVRGSELRAIRGCPVCRKPNFFIIPSTTFVTGKKKLELIETYKDNLAKIPCRNFKPNNPNSCPFGNSCFFLHQGPEVC